MADTPPSSTPLAPGETTTEFAAAARMQAWGTVLLAIAAGVTALGQVPGWEANRIIAAIAAVLGVVVKLAVALGYINSRTQIKAAALLPLPPPGMRLVPVDPMEAASISPRSAPPST